MNKAKVCAGAVCILALAGGLGLLLEWAKAKRCGSAGD